MDREALTEAFYQDIRRVLEKFSQTEENHAVYALVLDCDPSVGMITLRCNDRARFERMRPDYEAYAEEYGWPVYGFYGSEYSVGEFAFIPYEKSPLVKHFTDSYYYHAVGDYFGEGEPLEEIGEKYEEIYWSMITTVIKRLQTELEAIGIDGCEDLVFFCSGHDQTDEERVAMLRWTVEEPLVEKLLARGVSK